MIPVTGNLIELSLCHQRCFGQKAALFLLHILYPSLEQLDDPCSFREENRQSLSDHVHRGKEAEIPPKLVMIALERLLLHRQILVQFLLGRERNAVNPLQNFVFLIALPVSARALRQPECLDGSGAEQVRSRAEIHKLALPVEADDLSFRKLLNQLKLIRLFALGHQCDCFLFRKFKALNLQVFLDDLFHLRFQSPENLRRKSGLGINIIIESVFNRRTDGKLCRRIQALDRLCQNVCRRVAEQMLARLIREGQKVHIGVAFQLLRQRNGFSFRFRADHCAVDQPHLFCGVIHRYGRRKLLCFSLHRNFHFSVLPFSISG